MIPPCIDDKCLLYPACVNKRDIVCDLVRTFYHKRVVVEAITDTSHPDLSQTVWQDLKKTLPNMSTLKGKILQ